MPNMERFHKAQKGYYSRALEEIGNGRKETHWIWFVFPQLKDLGFGADAKFYGIQDRSEAEEYISDPDLRARLVEISHAVLDCGVEDISEIFGYPDDQKVRSCMTLFREVCPEEPVFGEVLDKFFSGEPDQKTLDLLSD